MEAGQHIRDYILEERIGAGGVGEVWRARHRHLDKVVAIKAVHRHLSQDAHFRDRSLLEAIAMAELDHPHIVGVQDFFFLDGISYLVMSYIDGRSLEDLIAQGDRLPLSEVWRISRDILEALNFAHSKGVIHRDVKPSNILVRLDGHAYLVDFGIALVMGKPRATRFGTNIGTPEYMSPEQIQSYELDHRTDVYSFGCVLYEMLTGRPPFGSQDAGQTEYDIMHGHVHEPPASLRALNPDVDAHTEAVVFRALAKEPHQRYSGCQELAEALSGHAGCKATPPVPQSADRVRANTRTASVQTRNHEAQRRRFTKISLSILLLLVGVGLILWLQVGRVSAPQAIEEKMFRKIDAGHLVMPIGKSAYDLWRAARQDEKNPQMPSRDVSQRLLARLMEYGEQFLQRQQNALTATDTEWLEALRVYEWAIYVYAMQTNAEVGRDTTVTRLCSDPHDHMKRLCARYSYSLGEIDTRKGRLAEAEQNFYRAQIYDETMCMHYIGIGEVYIKKEAIGNAINFIAKAARCDPSLCPAYALIAKYFEKNNIRDKADEFYAKAKRCAPKH